MLWGIKWWLAEDGGSNLQAKKIDVVDIHFVELQRCSSGFKISDRKFCSGAKLNYYFRQSGRQAILRYHTYYDIAY